MTTFIPDHKRQIMALNMLVDALRVLDRADRGRIIIAEQLVTRATAILRSEQNGNGSQQFERIECGLLKMMPALLLKRLDRVMRSDEEGAILALDATAEPRRPENLRSIVGS